MISQHFYQFPKICLMQQYANEIFVTQIKNLIFVLLRNQISVRAFANILIYDLVHYYYSLLMIQTHH